MWILGFGIFTFGSATSGPYKGNAALSDVGFEFWDVDFGIWDFHIWLCYPWPLKGNAALSDAGFWSKGFFD
jgi:hypothetical protein